MSGPGNNPDDDLSLGQTLRGFVAGQKVFRRYTLQKVLGRGGMGVVWLVRDDELEREVALKFLPELVSMDKESVADLKRETKRSLELTHPNIVRIYDFVSDGQAAAISMEYVDGSSLSEFKAEQPGRCLGIAQLEPWVNQLCAALDYAHTHARVVHRDLKPANLMVNSRSELKIADFGIARGISDSVSRVTMSAGTSGTLLYMSPQQANGEKAVPTDDIYSLGATLYDLLTGKPPFYGGDVLDQLKHKTPLKLAARRAELENEGGAIPAQWEEVIAACLAEDPAERPQSAGEVWDRLQAPAEVAVAAAAAAPPAPLAEPQLAAASPPVKSGVKPNRWALIVAGLYMLILAVLTVPTLLIAFASFKPAAGQSSSSAPWANVTELFGLYLAWPYWLWLGVMGLSQFVLLAVPVRVASSRPVTRGPVWRTVLAGGLMAAGLAFGAGLSIFEGATAVGGHMLWLQKSAIWLAVLTWAAWTVIFIRMSKTVPPTDLVSRHSRTLFKGSVLEFLIAVPCHIAARWRAECCAGMMTFVGLTMGVSVMLFAFGPAVFVLFVQRWKRLHPTPQLDGLAKK